MSNFFDKVGNVVKNEIRNLENMGQTTQPPVNPQADPAVANGQPLPSQQPVAPVAPVVDPNTTPAPDAPAVPPAPVEPTPAPQAEEAPVEQPASVAQDRSAFNCPVCGGEGLVGSPSDPSAKLCANCGGTGKV